MSRPGENRRVLSELEFEEVRAAVLLKAPMAGKSKNHDRSLAERLCPSRSAAEPSLDTDCQ
jgi:hypothetical protein